jgi:aspartyl protease family protein
MTRPFSGRVSEDGNRFHVRRPGRRSGVFKAINHTLAVLLFLSVGATALSADVNLNGIVGNKALLVIDGGKPRWLAVGESSPEGVKLVSVAGETAVFEMGGQRQTLKMGQSDRLSSPMAAGGVGAQSVVLSASGNGHFVTAGQINGQSVQFIVDTGASFITLGSSDAKRLNINYLGGQRVAMSTANGVVAAYRVKLDEVRVGSVLLNNVDGIVQPDNSMPVVLLGMSFLNRMEMKRDGETMVLKKRF